VSFTEDWYFPEQLDVLTRLCRQVSSLRGAIVEVGCWEGRSTIALAQTVAPAKVIAVDTWHGSPDEPDHSRAWNSDNVFETFKRNIAEHTQGNVRYHRIGWRDFFETFKQPVRFIHIDAQHTYEEVRDNVLAVLPHMVDGGIICGHDGWHEPVLRGAHEALESGERYFTNIKMDCTVWWAIKQKEDE
jgi:SAM-dependent methyltransferase